MAKKKSKTSNRTTMAGKLPDESLPMFNEEALSALTAKIENWLGASNLHQQAQTAATRNRHRGKKDRIISRLNLTSAAETIESRRGVKRDANGNAKTAGKQSGKDRDKSTPTEPKGDEKAALLQEILALGGTEEDLDLVADVASDEEDVSNTDPFFEKSFQKELAGFVMGLGIEQSLGSYEDESASEAAEEVWEATSDSDIPKQSDTKVVETARKEQAPPTQKTVTAPENVNRLVSNSPWKASSQTDST